MKIFDTISFSLYFKVPYKEYQIRASMEMGQRTSHSYVEIRARDVKAALRKKYKDEFNMESNGTLIAIKDENSNYFQIYEVYCDGKKIEIKKYKQVLTKEEKKKVSLKKKMGKLFPDPVSYISPE